MPCRVGSLKPPLAVRTGSQDWQSDQYRSEGLKSEAVLSDLSDNLGTLYHMKIHQKNWRNGQNRGG